MLALPPLLSGLRTRPPRRRCAALPPSAGIFDNMGASTDSKRDAEFARQQVRPGKAARGAQTVGACGRSFCCNSVLTADSLLLQELLRDRRSGKLIKDASKRRAGVAAYNKLSKEGQREFRKRQAGGEEPIYEEEPSWLGTIIMPVAPFSIPKYDNGERFDLKANYTDEGYEDEEADVMGKLGRAFSSLFQPKRDK